MSKVAFVHLGSFWWHTADDQRTRSVSAPSPASSCTFLWCYVPAKLGDLPVTAHEPCCAWAPCLSLKCNSPLHQLPVVYYSSSFWSKTHRSNANLYHTLLFHLSLSPVCEIFKARILSPITYILELPDVRKVCKRLTWWSSVKESAG